jgi:hypothetical protein
MPSRKVPPHLNSVLCSSPITTFVVGTKVSALWRAMEAGGNRSYMDSARIVKCSILGTCGPAYVVDCPVCGKQFQTHGPMVNDLQRLSWQFQLEKEHPEHVLLPVLESSTLICHTTWSGLGVGCSRGCGVRRVISGYASPVRDAVACLVGYPLNG